MKKIFSAVVFLFFLNLTGCYTVIWTPGMDNTIPKDTYAYDDSSYYNGNSDYSGTNTGDSSYYYGNSDNSNITISGSSDYFYDPYYYGTYTQYYYHPWWLSFATTQVKNKDAHKKDAIKTGSSTGTLRNAGDGRGDYGRNTGNSSGPIINNAPPTVSSPGSGSTSSGTTNSAPATRQSTTTTDNKPDNSDNSTRNSGSGSVRNNDGNRNDGGRK